MESRRHTGKWKKRYVPCMLFLLAVLKQCDAIEEQTNLNKSVTCEEDEYLYNNVCCNKCPAGFKLTQKCSGKGQRSTCKKCSDGTYQDNMNHFPNCFSCRSRCDPLSKEIEIRNCTHKEDRICGCQKGYYKYEVNDMTMSCKPCRKCGEGERMISPCGEKENTVCEQYKNCSFTRTDLSSPTVKTPGTSHPVQRVILNTWLPLQTPYIFLFVAIVLVCIISLYPGFKYWKKRKQVQHRQSSDSWDPENQVRQPETCLPIKEDENSLLAVQPSPTLPDCIPKEIKTHEFIYFVLEIVPLNRFKELVRRLNVSEQDIDRAERDNRAFADAQYQMLMVWIESSSKGGKSVLPHPLLQECVDRLNDMNLTACVESIEDKYT
ncbi:tumor necrosis factor receptor superfamily member 1A isoform X2 [Neoarius graeffei]|uniref:tumor necrosis factor receptor superfamily member 1A isoform X2 n=1 Tax=Neoarius graeffei TaxID=443677 RepID=UPI00298C2604|nr:tumor necrosis factor receptor superfamily member 1A isoform X2 [Neoarius graeffei]